MEGKAYKLCFLAYAYTFHKMDLERMLRCINKTMHKFFFLTPLQRANREITRLEHIAGHVQHIEQQTLLAK